MEAAETEDDAAARREHKKRQVARRKDAECELLLSFFGSMAAPGGADVLGREWLQLLRPPAPGGASEADAADAAADAPPPPPGAAADGAPPPAAADDASLPALATSIVWAALPTSVQPVAGSAKNLAKNARRLRKKRTEVESFLAVLLPLLAVLREAAARGGRGGQAVGGDGDGDGGVSGGGGGCSGVGSSRQQRPLRVVDFACGSGALLLPLAAALRALGGGWYERIEFVGVDMKEECCALLRERARDAGLGDVVSARCAMVEEFDGVHSSGAAAAAAAGNVVAAGNNGGSGGSGGSNGIGDDDSGVDVVLGLHACGNATDYIQEQALRLGAAYVLSPCCIGKLAFSLAGGTSFGAGRGAYGDAARVAATAVPAIAHPRSAWMAAGARTFCERAAAVGAAAAAAAAAAASAAAAATQSSEGATEAAGEGTAPAPASAAAASAAAAAASAAAVAAATPEQLVRSMVRLADISDVVQVAGPAGPAALPLLSPPSGDSVESAGAARQEQEQEQGQPQAKKRRPNAKKPKPPPPPRVVYPLRARAARLAKLHVELDRSMRGREMGFRTFQLKLLDHATAPSPKSDLLVGLPPRLDAARFRRYLRCAPADSEN